MKCLSTPRVRRTARGASQLWGCLLALAACTSERILGEPSTGVSDDSASADAGGSESGGGEGGAGEGGAGEGGMDGSGATTASGGSLTAGGNHGTGGGAGAEPVSCARGTLECGGECIDPSSAPEHCGACDSPCPADQICRGGACACADPSQTRCDEACVDLAADASHCGACGAACPAGETCMTGICSGLLHDGCSEALAHSVSISEIAVYQSGKVSVMRDGHAIAAAERPVDVVSGKDALVRVSVTPESGWVDRTLSARLELPRGQPARPLFDKKAMSGASDDATLSSTFNIEVPGELITTSASYSVRIVECSDSSGTAQRAAFPETGTEPLAARAAGALRLRFIPVVANGNTPDTSEARLTPIVEYLRALYPFPAIEISVGAPMTANWTIEEYGAGWTEVLQQLAIRHLQDDAPNDLYYYGLLEPAASLAAYCPNGCVGGIGYIAEASPDYQHLRVAMGISFAEPVTAETAAHELGHAQGRRHAPCGGGADLDHDFPHPDGSIGWWGLAYPDMLYPPPTTSDVMGYCAHRWISDHTYQALIERAHSLDSALGYRKSNPSGRFRVIVQSRFGAAWGVAPSSEVTAMGVPEAATILDARGRELGQATVYRARMGALGGASLMVPEPEPGWHAIRIQGSPALAFAP
ncbi:MAG TPA: hypothetical protein VI197_29545 [Polyangiaceae bacterium]